MIAISSYAAFLIMATVLAAWVGTTLARHGEALLHSQTTKVGSRSIRRLMLLGFYLVAAGATASLLLSSDAPHGIGDALISVMVRLGLLSLVLGIAQFYCLSVLSRMAVTADLERRQRRTRSRQGREDPLDRVFETIGLDAA